jgi:hypothetical protein
MSFHDLNMLPLWLVTLLFAGLLFGAVYAGHRLRRFVGTDPATVGSGQLLTGIVTIFSLMIGFTFSLALNRYDLRRDLVLEESNAIRAMHRSLVHVEEPGRSQIAASLLTYANGRLAFMRANLLEVDALAPRLARERENFNTVVANVVPISSTGMNQAQMLAHATRILDAGTRMDVISLAHVPPRVVLMLLFLSTGSALVIGISIGDRWSTLLLPITIWSVLLAMALFTIVDLDSTQWGSIRLDLTPLENALRALKPPSGRVIQ